MTSVARHARSSLCWQSWYTTAVRISLNYVEKAVNDTDRCDISKEDERDRFFLTHWPEAHRKFVNMTCKDNWTGKDAKDLVSAIGHLMVMINDMRGIELQYRAEIAALNALNKMKE